MDTRTALESTLKDALRAGDDLRKRTIRQALAAIKQADIDRQTTIDDSAALAIVQREIRTRRESIEEARKAGRPETVRELEAEIRVLEEFIPEAMSADELRSLVETAISETGAASPSDMGKVMKAVMPRVAGRAPGDQVSQAVRQILQSR
jgi:uncharacterized protein YqeY